MENNNLPVEKQTPFELYITAREAFERWKLDPNNIKIIDVRTLEEYIFVGSPTMAWRIPVIKQSYEWNSEQSNYPMELLPDFIARVSSIAQPDELLMVMCRSGGRSAIAAKLLAQAGFKNVYNIIDGMEGDINHDSESVAQSNLPPSGWKNTDCPWTKIITPEQMVLPTTK